MRLRTIQRAGITLAVFALFISVQGLLAEQPFEDGIRPSELSAIARLIPPDEIFNIKLLREPDASRLSAAVLVQSHHGWQILMISPIGSTAYRVSWKSQVLRDSFAVSSGNQLGTYGLSEGDAISFAGCAAHMCPDIFSVLLYVPWRHAAYVATCDGKQTTYSPSAPEYRDALNDILRERPGSATACSLAVGGVK